MKMAVVHNFIIVWVIFNLDLIFVLFELVFLNIGNDSLGNWV